MGNKCAFPKACRQLINEALVAAILIFGRAAPLNQEGKFECQLFQLSAIQQSQVTLA